MYYKVCPLCGPSFGSFKQLQSSVRRIGFWTNEYPNLFVTIDIGQMNIQIYSARNNGRE